VLPNPVVELDVGEDVERRVTVIKFDVVVEL